MTFFPSSELLLDPSPFRVSDTVPGQLARSTARELALQRSRAPRPFATRGAAPGLAGFALAAANEAWNLLLQQDIPIADQEFPVTAPAGTTYRLTGSITFKRLTNPPFDIEQTVQLDTLVDGEILSVGVMRQVVPFADGTTEVFHSIGVQQRLPGGTAQVQLFGARNVQLWSIVSLNGLNLSRADTPLVPIPGGFPASTLPQPGDTPDNDQAFPITLPGGIPGLPMPVNLPIIVPRPSSLGDRPIPIIYDPTIPLATRRVLPQMWLTPTGIQVGQGSPDDIVVVTAPETIPTPATPTQTDDLRQRIPPPTVVCLDTPEPPVDICDCEEIRQIVIEELDSKFPPKRPTTLVESIQPAGESGTFVLPAFTQWIELRIVVVPPNVRMQTGGTLAPEVRYNGWYSFGATGEASERIPFHYDFISILVPPKTSAFSYTVYSGGTAQATIGYLLPAP